jgi:hypothetical protein
MNDIQYFTNTENGLEYICSKCYPYKKGLYKSLFYIDEEIHKFVTYERFSFNPETLDITSGYGYYDHPSTGGKWKYKEITKKEFISGFKLFEKNLKEKLDWCTCKGVKKWEVE